MTALDDVGVTEETLPQLLACIVCGIEVGYRPQSCKERGVLFTAILGTDSVFGNVRQLCMQCDSSFLPSCSARQCLTNRDRRRVSGPLPVLDPISASSSALFLLSSTSLFASCFCLKSVPCYEPVSYYVLQMQAATTPLLSPAESGRLLDTRLSDSCHQTL